MILNVIILINHYNYDKLINSSVSNNVFTIIYYLYF